MHKVRFTLLAFVAAVLLSACGSSRRQTLYSSPNFTVYADSVVWGNYKAIAISSSEIQSNYAPVGAKSDSMRSWKLTSDIKTYPSVETNFSLVNALYNLSLEELEKNRTADGYLNTGKSWEGVWTRDMSYSIVLSLAYIDPPVARRCLMKKVKNGKIIQDTGSGGSWPVSTDRMTWALAAWEVYKVTGDKAWLDTIYPIVKRSLEADLKTIYYPGSLSLGESSFLDWREQTYPLWMKPVDIYRSECLGTSVVHSQVLHILCKMEAIEEGKHGEYEQKSEALKASINKYLWQPEKGYYAQYLYGRTFMSVSPKSEALGEALAVIFGVAGKQKSITLMEHMPVTPYGVPTIYPEIPDITPYHNNSIWPFVQSYWNWAAAKSCNEAAVTYGLASIYREAAMFLTNKENLVAQTGREEGTVINSDRQLWSVSGNIAMIYRVLLGMNFKPEGISFKPFVPHAYAGTIKVKGFRYRNAILNITLKGYGNVIKSFTVNGIRQDSSFVAGNLSGQNNIDIELCNRSLPESKINLVDVLFSPATPTVSLDGNKLSWNKCAGADFYQVVKNGIPVGKTTDTVYSIVSSNGYAEYQVKAIAIDGESFLSEPLPIYASKPIVLEAESFVPRSSLLYKNFSGKGFVELSLQKNLSVEIPFSVDTEGKYIFSARYSNGTARMCCFNTCAIRTLLVDGDVAGVVVMPVIEDNQWSDWGWSNNLVLNLKPGKHTLKITYLPYNENMNGDINTAMLDYVRLVKE